MKHFRYLDIARGIGLLLVIISHSCGLSPYLINYYIPLFFVVSGYLYKEGRSYGENIRHKAKRLLIPYFGYSAVLLAVLCGDGAESGGDKGFRVRHSLLAVLSVRHDNVRRQCVSFYGGERGHVVSDRLLFGQSCVSSRG